MVDRRKFAAALLAVSLGLLTLSSATAEVEERQLEQAAAVVETLHRSLLSVAAEQNQNLQQRVDTLAPVVRESFDFSYISRFLLRRTWASLDIAQQQSFTDLFERLSIANYASRFAEVGSESLVINESQPQGDKRIQVIASLLLDDRDVSLSYLLQPADNQAAEQWLIVNVIADGVSDLALRRAEYNRVIADTGFDGLLEHIKQQIEDLN